MSTARALVTWLWRFYRCRARRRHHWAYPEERCSICDIGVYGAAPRVIARLLWSDGAPIA